MNSIVRSVALSVGLLAVSLVAGDTGAALHEQSLLRRPIALAMVDEGRTLLTANRTSGTVSVIDARDMRVVDEVRVGRQLSDMAVCSDNRRILITDEAAGELIVLKWADRKLTVAQRLPVSPYPVCVTVSADGARA